MASTEYHMKNINRLCKDSQQTVSQCNMNPCKQIIGEMNMVVTNND
jgi:hypothetical protein